MSTSVGGVMSLKLVYCPDWTATPVIQSSEGAIAPLSYIPQEVQSIVSTDSPY